MCCTARDTAFFERRMEPQDFMAEEGRVPGRGRMDDQNQAK
jgi:hypothetical protein